MTDKMIEAIEHVSAKIALLADKYGPEIIETGLSVVRLTGLNKLILSVGGALVGGVVAYVAYHWVRKECAGKDDFFDTNPIVVFFGGIAAFFGAVAASVNIFKVLDIWNWVAIFEPKLYIARKLLGL